MVSLNDCIHKYKLKNTATSNVKRYQTFSWLSLNDVGNYLGGGPFSSDIGITNLHATKCTHWVLYIHEKIFDSYGCPLPQKLSKFIIRRNGLYLYSEYKLQGLTSKRDFFVQFIVHT